MRKLATKLLVALGLLTSGGAWAQTSGTVGLLQENDGTAIKVSGTDYKGTLKATSTVTFGDITVAYETRQNLSLYNNRKRAAYLDGNAYYAIDMWRTLANTGSIVASFTETQAVDVKITVPVGKVLNISKIKAQLLTNEADYNWKVAVIDEDGATLKGIESKQPSKKSGTTPSINEDVSSDASLQGLKGTLVLRIYVYPAGAGTSKYFAIPYLTLDATLEEPVQTQYSKPVITVGAYDANTGTYSVTIEKTDDDGAIFYKVGEGEYTAYSEALSVAPNTTITAKVTGDAYKDSEEASKTTGAMPTLATPTAAVAGYNFAANTYNITLAGPAGATIKYSTDNWATSGVYSETIAVLPGATLKAKAEQTNMTTSAELSYAVAAAPVAGSDETPTTSGTYASDVSYSMAAITIPGGCIAGQTSSGNSSINGSIKTRTNQGLVAVPEGNGFYVNVNPGYTVTSISIKTLSNKDKVAITCDAVYVDGNPENVLGTSVECPYASAKDVEAVDIVVSGIAAKERIEFDFIQTEQAQMIITVTYEYAGDITLNNVESLKYGFATLSAPHNFTVKNGTAYKATVSGSNLVLTEIEGVIPAKSGVVVVGEKGANVTVKYTAEEATADVAGNELKGTSVRTQTSELKGTATHLMMLHKTTSAFVSYTGEYFPANKAYVLVGGGANAVKSLSIVFGDEASATGINSVNVRDTKVAEGTKHIINGQIVIKTQNGYMNLMGVKVK